MCPRCDAYRVSGRWIPRGETALDEHLFNMICDLLDPLFAPKVPATFEVQILSDSESPAARLKQVQVRVIANAEDFTFQQEEQLTVPITTILCEQCKRTSGGYFEAILQIRASTGKLSEHQENTVLAFIDGWIASSTQSHLSLKVTPTRGGIDIKFHSSRMCRSLAKALTSEFGLLFGVSSKVTGRTRTGKTQSRENFVVRFPPFQIGDVIAYESRIYHIKSIHNGRYTITDLESEHRRVFSPKELISIDWEPMNDHIHEFMIISISRESFQLMNQQDYTIYDLPTPPFSIEVGEILRAVKWNDRLVILPPDGA